MTTDATTAAETITERVRARYARAAHQAQTGVRSCCSSDCCSSTTDDPVTDNLYDAEQTAGLPEEAVLASLGCGNPTALIDLQPGETVLDLGSGGGIDPGRQRCGGRWAGPRCTAEQHGSVGRLSGRGAGD
jgi:hypothetical protein